MFRNLLNPQTISELEKAFESSPGGFLVVEQGLPRFAVLDYETYQRLKNQPQARQPRPGRILVTGGAGYIGSVTARLLLDRGYEVVILDQNRTSRLACLPECQFIQGDLMDRALLDKIFSEQPIESVIHFAASVEVEESVQNPGKYFQNNVVTGLQLLDAMVEHGVKSIIFSSSAAVYGEPSRQPIPEETLCQPTNPYGASKLMFEQILQWYQEAFGLQSVSLRYFNAGGAWPEAGLGYSLGEGETHLLPRVLDVAAGRNSEIKVFGQDYETPDGTCIRDFVHVRDLAEAHLLALQKLERERGAYTYNVGTGLGHSVLEVIDTAVEVTGRMIAMQYAARRPGDPAKLIADSSKLKKDLAWQPKYDLRAILESSWQWVRQNKK